jgi:signal transduction histidine kinase
MPKDFVASTDYVMAIERNSYLEDLKWLSDFLGRTTKADSVIALSSIITEILPQVFPFAYVSIFFLGNNSKLELSGETGTSLRNANFTEISKSVISDSNKWPCSLDVLFSGINGNEEPYAVEAINDLLCEPIKSMQGIVALLCYQLNTENLSQEQRTTLDLTILQIALSFERILKEQRMIYGATCRTNENGEIERIILRSDRQACIAEMALGVADGIRNPITVIGGLVKRISKQMDFEKSLQKDWDILLQEAGRLERLVRDFEEIAQKREILLERIDVNQVVVKSVEIFRKDFLKKRKTAFKLNFESTPCLVKIDKRLMGVALTHLYMNASEAAKENGIIYISTHIIHEKIVIKVKDNGDGITPEFIDRIFDPFFSTKSGGTGLGLTYVQQIINEHGGEINVESHPGDGTSFIITLPGDGSKS